MKIKEPDWKRLIVTEGEHTPELLNLNVWFAENIAPYEFYKPEDAVEVYGRRNEMQDNMYFNFDEKEYIIDTHKALLINIEPIKKETAEDVLRDFVREWDKPMSSEKKLDHILDRAKALLK